MYKVKLDKFEGPLELLLELIEKEDMDITELSISRVADEYLEYIHNNVNIELSHLADFLSVAAKLILIKSRALLPSLKLTDDEEKEIKDLQVQLIEFKKFKEASLKIAALSERNTVSLSRSGYAGVESVFSPPKDINAHDLKKHFLRIISEIPVLEKLHEEIVSEVVTLEEKISNMSSLIKRRMESSFSEMISTSAEKIEIIVSFLAILEMVKQKVIEVEQKNLFDDIKLKLRET